MSRIWRTFMLAALAGAFTISCTGDDPVQQSALPPASPVFLAGNAANGFGQCMGDDALLYNTYAPNNEKSSWGNKAIPSGNFCTANDIYLASAVVTHLVDEFGVETPVTPGQAISCVEGETFQVRVAAQLGQNAASARTDIGVWIGQLAEGSTDPFPTQAVSGTCNHYNLTLGTSNVQNLDSDQCGDMNSAAGELTDLDLEVLTLSCTPNENNLIDVPTCIGWTVPGGDRVCPYQGGGNTEELPIQFRMGTVPGNTSKCNCEPFELEIIVQKKAYLEVRKELDPTDDAGLFDLYIDEGTADQILASDQGHNGTTGIQEVGAGTNIVPGADHTFQEMAGTDTDLGDYETSWECHDRTGTSGDRGTGSGVGPETINLQPDDDVVCTFTNARKPEVKLVKMFDPTTDPGAVDFTIEGSPDDNGGSGYGHAGETAWHQFDIGTDVDFSEAGNGIDLGDYESSWSCDNGESGTGTSGATGALAAGDRVTCTFTNALKPVVKAVKDFSPDTDPGLVDFDVGGNADDNGAAGYGDGGTTAWYMFAIGANPTVSESGHTGTDLGDYESSWSCDSGTSGSGTSGSTGALAAGDSITCTFVNAKNPVVKLVKQFDPTDDGGAVDFTLDDYGTDNNGGSGYGHNGETQWYEYAIGDDVNFSEAGNGISLSNYESDWSCDNGASGSGTSGSTGTLAAGDQVTCTFTNARKPEVRAVKILDPTDDPGLVDFDIGGNADDNSGAGYGHNGTTSYYVFDIGANPTVSESAHTGTDLGDYESSWSCDSGSSGSGTSGSTGTLAAGDQITCTFTNARKPEVRVKKVLDPTDDPGLVSFMVGSNSDDNSAAGYSHDGITQYYQFAIGADVSISEAAFGSTDLGDYASSWSCDSGTSGSGTSGNTGALAAGDQITCTFTNVRLPEVRVMKMFIPDTDLGLVDITVNALTPYTGIGHGGGTGWITLAVGDGVAISETGNTIDLASYISSWECHDEGGVAGDRGSGLGTSGSMTGTLAAGDQVTCVFTNQFNEPETETAYAFGGSDPLVDGCFIPDFDNWGWTNSTIEPGEYEWPVYAAAAQCDPDNGVYAGYVTVTYGIGTLDVVWHLEPGFTLEAEHIYAGDTEYPQKNGSDTVAPGQYYIDYAALDGGAIYVIVHGVVTVPGS